MSIKSINYIEAKSLYLVQFEFSLPRINYSNYKKCASNVFSGVNRKTYCVCSYLTTEIIKLNATLPQAFCTNDSHTHTHTPAPTHQLVACIWRNTNLIIVKQPLYKMPNH